MPHKIEYRVKAQLTAYSKKPSSLSSSLGKTHNIILGYIASNDWKDLYIASFDRDAKKFTAIQEKLQLCKDIATFVEIKIVPANEQLDEEFNLKSAVIEYLAKYIIKRRANYLYIWTLFMKRDYELSSLNTIMQGKVNDLLLKMSASPDSAPNLKENMFTTTDIITKMQSVINTSQMSPEDKRRALSMLTKHSNTATSVEAVLIDFTVLLNECKSKLDQYKHLVFDVLPLLDQMAESTNNSDLAVGPYLQTHIQQVPTQTRPSRRIMSARPY